MGMKDDVEVYAVCYATQDRKAWQNFLDNILSGDISDQNPMPVYYYFWVIRQGDSVTLVDTGCDLLTGRSKGIEIANSVEVSLEALKIAPDQVSDVIVTHLHWDHVGNHDLFRNARYHLQGAELAFATSGLVLDPVLFPYRFEDVSALLQKLYAGRVNVLAGAGEIKAGIHVRMVGGHSEGLQVVIVDTARGPLVLASDAAHYYENLEQDRLFPAPTNAAHMIGAYHTIRQLAASPDHWIPGHDPKVLSIYPPLAGHLAHIVRVDVEPSSPRMWQALTDRRQASPGKT